MMAYNIYFVNGFVKIADFIDNSCLFCYCYINKALRPLTRLSEGRKSFGRTQQSA